MTSTANLHLDSVDVFVHGGVNVVTDSFDRLADKAMSIRRGKPELENLLSHEQARIVRVASRGVLGELVQQQTIPEGRASVP
jgi:hypothetical protein